MGEGWGSHSWIRLGSLLKTQVSSPTADLRPFQKKRYWRHWWSLLKLTSEEGLGKWPDGGGGWLNGVTAKKDGGFLGGWGVFSVCVCVEEVSFEPPPSAHVHKCVPAAIVTLSYSRTEGLKQTGSKQCLAPFVSRLPFFFSPPSQSTGPLCIDFPHSAARRPLSAVLYALFWLFLSATSPHRKPPSSGILYSVRTQCASWLDATH